MKPPFDPIVSAHIERGVHTNRVRVRKARRKAAPLPMPAPPVIVPPARAAQALEVAAPDIPFVTICISTYPEDLERMDAIVAELKRRGLRRANRSWLIRFAIAQLHPDAIAPSKG